MRNDRTTAGVLAILTLVLLSLTLGVSAQAPSFDLIGPPDGAYVRAGDASVLVSWEDAGAAVETYDWILFNYSGNVRLGVVELLGLTPAADLDGMTCDAGVCSFTIDLDPGTTPSGQYVWTVLANLAPAPSRAAVQVEASNAPFFFTINTNPIELIQNGGFETCVDKVADPWTGTGCKLDAAKANTGTGFFNGKPGLKIKQNIVHPSIATLAASDELTLSGFFDAKASAGNIAKLTVKYVDPAGGAGADGKDKVKLSFTTDSVGYEELTDAVTLTGPVTSVKVQVGSNSGKVKADDLSLVLSPLPVAPRGLLPVPAY